MSKYTSNGNKNKNLLKYYKNIFSPTPTCAQCSQSFVNKIERKESQIKRYKLAVKVTKMLMLNGNHRKQILIVLRKLSIRYGAKGPRYNHVKMCSNAPIDYTVPAGTPGAGAGKGGGSGGSIREAGGGLGKLGAALEEGYFHQHNKEQLKQIKKKLQRGEPISHSEKPPK